MRSKKFLNDFTSYVSNFYEAIKMHAYAYAGKFTVKSKLDLVLIYSFEENDNRNYRQLVTADSS